MADIKAAIPVGNNQARLSCAGKRVWKRLLMRI